ncbi:pyrroline-5-carboxylate reductase [Neisseria montereyensis]|uniref:Pyrroline-5-carboxylate reductase n=1 Tax=Neisseria montereyensis TaxID=2973938 RepID=A0ABT2FF03_9NEIS|nr:pyrroline-5-carboxylate reductase [Neisseria montereyensis]MCS4534545.1 pyrroline-5-carboxylate reductase [Neisseria montereyensis]
MTIYFLGGGNMAEAIASGLVRQGGYQIHIANRGAEKRERLAKTLGVAVSERLPALNADDILVLAVKPQDMQSACEGVETNGALVLSVAAGLSVNTLSSYLNGTRRIIRTMPNTPGRVGLGVSGLFAADGVSDADKQAAETVMSAIGQVVWLADEAQIHAITGITGSGPAYVFYLMNALQEAAVAQGFDNETARQLSLATFKGAVGLAGQSGEAFGVLQQNVTSKGGTTFAALETFKEREVAQAIGAGVDACVARSKEIAQQFEAGK